MCRVRIKDYGSGLVFGLHSVLVMYHRQSDTIGSFFSISYEPNMDHKIARLILTTAESFFSFADALAVDFGFCPASLLSIISCRTFREMCGILEKVKLVCVCVCVCIFQGKRVLGALMSVRSKICRGTGV